MRRCNRTPNRITATASVVGLAALTLSACATVSPQYATRDNGVRTPSPQMPSGVPRYKIGPPYQVGGQWYYPAEQPDYEETGFASWYGEAFNGKPTANGEVFDMFAPSAAHKTLPLPSIVEVTNLDNGRSMQLRVNDRGPFVDGRIIDLSRGAAEELGVLQPGTARVRVKYVGPASLDARSLAPVQIASAPPTESATAPRGPITQTTLAPLEQPAPAPMVEVAPPPAYGSAFQVQAGAFSERANAERVATALADTGLVEIQPIERNGATLYRVMVRDIADEARASVVRDRVIEIGLADARIILPN